MICLAFFLFAYIQLVTPYGLVGIGNVRSFKTLVAGAENKPKCHVRGTWVGLTSSYKITCYQCDDQNDQKAIVIYSGDTMIDSAFVNTCSHFNVAGSVTVVPAEGSNKHTIEYDKMYKKCVSVSYGSVRGKEERCPINRFLPKTVYGYYNGWKLQLRPWTTGVVREFISTFYDTSNCEGIIGWKSALRNVLMVCYKCETDFVVKLYDDGKQIAIATVGTCRTTNVEYSIDVMPINWASRNTVGIQYMLYWDKCIYKTYTQKGGTVEVATKDACVFQRESKLAFMRGFRNGWKIASIGL